MLKKALFLDRDGIINILAQQPSGELDSPQDEAQVQLMEGIVSIIRFANEHMVPVIEISNQPGVAKGKLTLEESELIESKVHSLLQEHGVYTDKTYRCFHHPQATLPEYKKDCDCRKPKPGMLIQAAKELELDLASSFFLGDNLTDVEAGYAAGCKTLFFPHTPHKNDTPEKLEKHAGYLASHVISSLREVVPILSKEWDIPNKVKAVIVAGGKGERLRPITNTIPKPMVEVGGKPILLHTIELLKKHGVTDFIIALCYLPEVIQNYFGDGSRFGVTITYIYENEESPKGTAGAISPARHHVTGTFIVTYADIIRDLDVTAMLEKHTSTNTIASIHVYEHEGKAYKSSLSFNEQNILTNFKESTQKEEKLGGEQIWSNGSLYIFEPQIFDHIHNENPVDFAHDIFQKLLESKTDISVFPSSEYFIDIGTKEKLDKANEDYKNKNSQG